VAFESNFDGKASNLEDRLGMSLNEIREAVEAGRVGPFSPWEGTVAFSD